MALLILFYLHPARSSYRTPSDICSSCFKDVVRKAESIYPPGNFKISLMVLGDFDFPDSDWSSMSSTNKRELEFLQDLNSLELLPIITTRQTHRCGYFCDIILTNDKFITGYSIEDNSSNHPSTIIFTYCSECNKPSQRPSELSF